MGKNKRKSDDLEDGEVKEDSVDFIPLDGENFSKRAKTWVETTFSSSKVTPPELTPSIPQPTSSTHTPPDLTTQLATLDSLLISIFTTIESTPSSLDALSIPQRNYLQTLHGLSTSGQTPWLKLPRTLPTLSAPLNTSLPPLPPVTSQALLDQVFTHPSILGAHGNVSQTVKKLKTMDRLEFLGDSYIHTAVTRLLYDRFPLTDEGVLTVLRDKLVNNTSLAEISIEYGLDKKLRVLGEFSAHDAKGRYGGRNKAYADVMEAYIGAAVLDAPDEAEGIRRVREWASAVFGKEIESLPESKQQDVPLDNMAKNKLYGMLVKSPKTGGKLWYQDLPNRKDPNTVVCVVYFEGYEIKKEEIGRGKGPSKKVAEMRAAMDALTRRKTMERIVAARIRADPDAPERVSGNGNRVSAS